MIPKLTHSTPGSEDLFSFDFEKWGQTDDSKNSDH